MSVCTATVINSSHNIMGTNDRSYIIEFNDSIVNKIKSFKKGRERRTRKLVVSFA